MDQDWASSGIAEDLTGLVVRRIIGTGRPDRDVQVLHPCMRDRCRLVVPTLFLRQPEIKHGVDVRRRQEGDVFRFRLSA